MLLQMIDLKGEIPNRRPRLLPPNYATEAVNVRMEDGAASPLRAPVDTLTVSALTQTIYRGGNTWRTWNTDVNAVPGPVRAERLYITGDGLPKLVDENGITYALALPEPATGPVVTALQTPDPDLKESIVYAYTWVTALDEESAPSPLSAQVEWSPGVTIRLSGFATRPANRAVNRIRFYRSQTSTSGTTQLFYVGEISAAATFWDHDIVINPIVEPISVAHFGTPPDDLKGLTVLPNGIIAGFYGKTLAFSEPYIPHAWPASYEIQLDFEVVGLAAFGSLLAVMTTGQPYLVDGTHPDSMSALKLEESLPCVSAKGIVDLGYAAAYPSTEGLVLIQRDGPRLVSKQMFSRDQWNALQPASIIAGRHLGRYVMAFDGNLPARAEKAAIVDFSGEVPFLVHADITASAMFTDVTTGQLFYLDGTQIRSWDDAAAPSLMRMRWRSRAHVFPYPETFSCLEVRGGETTEPTQDLYITVFADGQELAALAGINQIHRLPSVMAEVWVVQIEGNVIVDDIALAGSLEELQGRS